jgi:hypothetical protein
MATEVIRRIINWFRGPRYDVAVHRYLQTSWHPEWDELEARLKDE